MNPNETPLGVLAFLALFAALKATAPCRSANAHLPAIPSSPCVTTIDLGESGAA